MSAVSDTQNKPAPKRTIRPRRSAKANTRLSRDRELAKIGLTIGLGALVVTGFVMTKWTRRLHVLAGVATVGLSVWHHMLYQNKNNNS